MSCSAMVCLLRLILPIHSSACYAVLTTPHNNTSTMLSILLLAIALLSLPTHGFVHSSPRSARITKPVNSNTNAHPAFVGVSTDAAALGATAGEEDATSIPTTSDGMKDLIIDLSKESTDDVRRSRLQAIIVQGLDEGDADSFSQLFQQSLEAVGNEVQAEARELAMKRYEEKDAAETINEAAVASATNNGGDSPIRVETVNETSEGKIKSPLETQLWALVDMMVQSKTMIKKVQGQLGSKGEFQ